MTDSSTGQYAAPDNAEQYREAERAIQQAMFALLKANPVPYEVVRSLAQQADELKAMSAAVCCG